MPSSIALAALAVSLAACAVALGEVIYRLAPPDDQQDTEAEA